jgi:two-component system chemotaxis response regulator CheY
MLDLDVGEIIEAEDGLDAIEKVNGPINIDFILADLNMPKMGGIEMISALRDSETTKSIPVAIVSTESNSTRIEKLLADGATDYLHKPFKPEQIRDLLLRTVGV